MQPSQALRCLLPIQLEHARADPLRHLRQVMDQSGKYARTSASDKYVPDADVEFNLIGPPRHEAHRVQDSAGEEQIRCRGRKGPLHVTPNENA